MARNVLIITSQEHQTTTGILPEIRSFNFSVKTKKNKKGFFTNTKESEIQNFDELLDKFCEVWGRRPRQQIFLI